MPYTWRKPNRLLVMHIRLNIEDWTVGPANAAPQGLSENIVCALKLATNLAEGNPMERIVQGVTEATNTQMVRAMSQFISADNDKARVCMGFFLRSTTLYRGSLRRMWILNHTLKHTSKKDPTS